MTDELAFMSGAAAPVEKTKSKEAKAALSLSFIMGGFLVCWLPFFIWMPLVHLMVSTTEQIKVEQRRELK